MLWHLLNYVAGFIFGWYLIDALRGVSRLGASSKRIAQALEDLCDVLTEDAEADEPTTIVNVGTEDSDAFVQAIRERIARLSAGPALPPPIPEDAD